jgi:methionyl-tRNA formyltransferase
MAKNSAAPGGTAVMQPKDLRTVFMGTPEFALLTLQGLIDSGCNLVGIFTQPDRPKGRGKHLQPPPVKVLAKEHAIPVFQPVKLRDQDAVNELSALKPDLIVVVAYGQILPQSVLDLPAYGCINVHASLLPKYRGAAPINKAIMDGERKTGITTMFMDAGLDTGDMLIKRALSIGPDETAGELHDRLAQLGQDVMIETLQKLCAGTLKRVAQDGALSSYAPMLKKEDGLIDWTRPCQAIHNQVRGLNPWPGAYTYLDGKLMKLQSTKPIDVNGLPGTVLRSDPRGVLVACGTGSLLLGELQLEGRKWLKAEDFLRGHPLFPGTVLGATH